MSPTKISPCPVLLTELPRRTDAARQAGTLGKMAKLRQYWWTFPLAGMLLLLCFGGSMIPRQHFAGAPGTDTVAEADHDSVPAPTPMDPPQDCQEPSANMAAVVQPQSAEPPLVVHEDPEVHEVAHVEQLELPPFAVTVEEKQPEATSVVSEPKEQPPAILPHGFTDDEAVGPVLGEAPVTATHVDSDSPLHEVACFKGHTDTATCAAFVPGKHWILSCSRDQTLRLWDPVTGKEVKKLGSQPSDITCLAISRDGKRVLTGSGHYDPAQKSATDCVIRLWDLGTGKELQHYSGHTGPITSVAWAPDGSCFLSASHDRSVRLWETSTGRVLRSFTGHGSAVQSVAFGVDGYTGYSAGGTDGTVRVWNLRTGQQAQVLREKSDPVKCVLPLPDGRHIVSAGGDVVHGEHGDVNAYGCKLHVWDLTTGKIVCNLDGHAAPVMSLACSSDGSQLVSGDLGGTLCVWDMHGIDRLKDSAGAVLPQLTQTHAHASWIWSSAFSADGHFLVSASADRSVKLWKLP